MVPHSCRSPPDEDDCDCPNGPDKIEDGIAGQIMCRNCGVILSPMSFGQLKPLSPEKIIAIPPKNGFISPDLFRALRLNHSHSYQHRRMNRVEQEIKQFWQALELPEGVRDRAIFLAHRYLQLASKSTSLQARARVCLYYAILEAKIPVVMTVFESTSLSAAFLRRRGGRSIWKPLRRN